MIRANLLHSGYCAFGVGYDLLLPVVLRDIWGLFSVSPKNRDIWEEYSRERISLPALQKMPTRNNEKKLARHLPVRSGTAPGLGCTDE